MKWTPNNRVIGSLPGTCNLVVADIMDNLENNYGMQMTNYTFLCIELQGSMYISNIPPLLEYMQALCAQLTNESLGRGTHALDGIYMGILLEKQRI